MFQKRRVVGIAVVVVLLVASLGAGAVMAKSFLNPVSEDGVISGAYQKVNGMLRLVNGEEDVRPSEVFIQWNQKGLQGEPGLAGPQGEPGLPGEPGEDGRDGKNGLPGEPGEDGRDGKNGLPGLQGEQGLQGLQGDQGEQGPQGVQGLPGEPGPAGPAGAQGQQGPAGPTGATGSVGPVGPQGETGPAGGISGYERIASAWIEVPPLTGGSGQVYAPDGKKIVSAGFKTGNTNALRQLASHPTPDCTVWNMAFYNEDMFASHSFLVFGICVDEP